MTREKKIWNRMIREFQSEVGREQVETWFVPCRLEKLDSKLALVRVPNKYVGDWLREKYYDNIADFFKDNLQSLPEIYFIPEKRRRDSKNKTPAFLQSQRLNPVWTFENFVTGESNLLAWSAALEAAQHPGGTYNPLYIYGGSGLGKSHLINSVGNKAIEEANNWRVSYLSTDSFVTSFSLAKLNSKLHEFRTFLCESTFLLMDDIHLLNGRTQSQEELLFLFNHLWENGSQMVFTSTIKPTDIDGVIPKLQSRLGWGVVCEIDKPEHETKVSIIRQRAKEEKLNIPDDVAFFLAKSSGEISEIIEAIVRLGVYASLHRDKIDISTVRAVTEKRNSEGITVNDIQKVAANYYNISLTDLLSNKSSRKFSYPRKISMYLARTMTNTSITDIARAFGKKHHSSVIYAEKSIKADKENKKQVVDDINQLYKLVKKVV